MIKKIIEKYCVKHAMLFFEKIKGQREYQALFEDLNRISLNGMNIGGWTNTINSGEANALQYIFDKLKHKNSVILFDVGANVGNYSILLQEVFGIKAEIFSIAVFIPCTLMTNPIAKI